MTLEEFGNLKSGDKFKAKLYRNQGHSWTVLDRDPYRIWAEYEEGGKDYFMFADLDLYEVIK